MLLMYSTFERININLSKLASITYKNVTLIYYNKLK